jgi:hypothetical protein
MDSKNANVYLFLVTSYVPEKANLSLEQKGLGKVVTDSFLGSFIIPESICSLCTIR